MTNINWWFRPDPCFQPRSRPARNHKALEAVHPMFMGGTYLPDTEGVEIARIQIKSTTYDVAAVYATPDGAKIRYQIVDEYSGETLEGPTELESDDSLTLRQLVDFVLGGWPLFDVLQMNCRGDLEASLDFFTAESAFYPDFYRACRYRVIAHFGDCTKLEGKGASWDEIKRVLIEIMEQREEERISEARFRDRARRWRR